MNDLDESPSNYLTSCLGTCCKYWSNLMALSSLCESAAELQAT